MSVEFFKVTIKDQNENKNFQRQFLFESRNAFKGNSNKSIQNFLSSNLKPKSKTS